MFLNVNHVCVLSQTQLNHHLLRVVAFCSALLSFLVGCHRCTLMLLPPLLFEWGGAVVSFGGTLLFAIALVITPLFPFDSQMRGVLLCSNALSERILKQLISLVTVHNQKERKKSREKERERTHCTANAQPFEKSNQNKRTHSFNTSRMQKKHTTNMPLRERERCLYF